MSFEVTDCIDTTATNILMDLFATSQVTHISTFTEYHMYICKSQSPGFGVADQMVLCGFQILLAPFEMIKAFLLVFSRSRWFEF